MKASALNCFLLSYQGLVIFHILWIIIIIIIRVLPVKLSGAWVSLQEQMNNASSFFSFQVRPALMDLDHFPYSYLKLILIISFNLF